MTLRQLIPWETHNKGVLSKKEDDPMFALQREVNNLFDNFFDGFGLAPTFGKLQKQYDSFVPKVDVKEKEKNFQVTAELPGIDEKDLDVSLTEGTLSIKGEKKSEVEDKKDGYHRIERSYGSFSRLIALPEGIDEEKIEASYKKGVLKVVIPKTEKAQEAHKKIEVKAE